MTAFPLDAVKALVVALDAAGARATIAPPDVNPPGCWLRLGTLTLDPVLCDEAVGILAAEVICVVPDTTDEAALDALAALVDLVLPVVDVAGPLRFQGTILPGPDLTALPSIVIPIVVT